jgi:hypothetical protein
MLKYNWVRSGGTLSADTIRADAPCGRTLLILLKEEIYV